MSMWKRFIKWMNTPPKESDLFFVHIRETYQAIKGFRDITTRGNKMEEHEGGLCSKAEEKCYDSGRWYYERNDGLKPSELQALAQLAEISMRNINGDCEDVKISQRQLTLLVYLAICEEYGIKRERVSELTTESNK